MYNRASNCMSKRGSMDYWASKSMSNRVCNDTPGSMKSVRRVRDRGNASSKCL